MSLGSGSYSSALAPTDWAPRRNTSDTDPPVPDPCLNITTFWAIYSFFSGFRGPVLKCAIKSFCCMSYSVEKKNLTSLKRLNIYNIWPRSGHYPAAPHVTRSSTWHILSRALSFGVLARHNATAIHPHYHYCHCHIATSRARGPTRVLTKAQITAEKSYLTSEFLYTACTCTVTWKKIFGSKMDFYQHYQPRF